jgi:lysophospholipase L1-like esterase
MSRHPLRSFVSRSITGPLIRVLMRATFEHRRSHFEAVGAPPGRIVFLGDSITELGLWEEHYPAAAVLNRGSSGEVSTQVLQRLDSAINEPAAVFVLIGTNDLAADHPESAIAANLGRIVDGIEQRAPGTPVYVQSVMPRRLRWRSEVQSLNHRYQEIVAGRGDHVRYLDLWPVLATARGELRPEFTSDGLHLNGAGYRAWTALLEPYVSAVAATR